MRSIILRPKGRGIKPEEIKTMSDWKEQFEKIWETLQSVSKEQKELTESQKKTDEQMKKTDEQMKKTDEKLDRLCKQVGGMSNNDGDSGGVFLERSKK